MKFLFWVSLKVIAILVALVIVITKSCESVIYFTVL